MRRTEYVLYGASANLHAAFVSDLHNEDYEKLLQDIQRAGVDMILVGGDVVHDSTRAQKGFDFLREAAAVAPTFCSLGNHELKNVVDVRRRVAQTGAVLLDNSFVDFGGMTIGGLTSGLEGVKQGRCKETPAPSLTWLGDFSEAAGTRVLLSHHPEYYPRFLCERNFELVLSGHAHGGQWRFFGRGVFAPGQGIFPRFTAGAYQKMKRVKRKLTLSNSPTLIVSRGLANHSWVPRINNPLDWLDIYFTKDLP